MAKQAMDFTLSETQVAAIVSEHVLNAMIDRTRFDAKIKLDVDGALVTVTRKRVRKPKLATVPKSAA